MADDTMGPNRTVSVFSRVTPDYRLTFYQNADAILRGKRVRLRVISGQPRPGEALTNAIAALPFGQPLRNRYIGKLCWAQALRTHLRGSDVVVFEQSSALVQIYGYLVARQLKLGGRVAFWGHGANMNVAHPQPFRSAWKRYWLRRVDWWFGYTEQTRHILLNAGFPSDRITVVENAVDTSGLARAAASISDDAKQGMFLRLFGRRREATDVVGVFCGRLVPLKWIPFLLEALTHIRQRVPGFHMVVIGDGPERMHVERFREKHGWCACVGAVRGEARAIYFAMSDLWLNPGMTGLAILDAFAMGLPFLTTDNGVHSPEIAYLDAGANGAMSPPDPERFARMVANLLAAPERLAAMKHTARRAGKRLTAENMAANFASGIFKLLGAD